MELFAGVLVGRLVAPIDSGAPIGFPSLHRWRPFGQAAVGLLAAGPKPFTGIGP